MQAVTPPAPTDQPTSSQGWRLAFRSVVRFEWLLLVQHRALSAACVGLLFVPALYALIYLYGMWDPASHARSLPAGLISMDQGASYGGRDLNLGRDVLLAIEAQGQFAYQRLTDLPEARRRVRQGDLAFLLEVPADFSRNALPGAAPGAGKLTIYTSEGNNYSSAGLARRFAPEVAQRVNTMLNEARWSLVLSTAAGSQRDLDGLRATLGELHQGAADLTAGLRKAHDGGSVLASNSKQAELAATRLQAGVGQLADAAPQLTGGLRQVAPLLRSLDARRPPDSELQALRQGTRQLVEGQRELGRGLDALAAGSRELDSGMAQFKAAVDEVPLFGSRLLQGMAPLVDGVQQLAGGLATAAEGHARLQTGAQRIDEAVSALTEGTQRAGQAAAQAAARLPDDQRLDSFVDGTRELQRGADVLQGGLRQLAGGNDSLHLGLAKLLDGAGRLDAGLALLRQALPVAVNAPEGSAKGLALSVQPVVEVVAPVPSNGAALTPNFVPLALWVGAVMAVFLVHFRRIVEPLQGLPRTAQVAGKLALPLLAVVAQALLMWWMLVALLALNIRQPSLFVLTLLSSSVSFLLLVFALVRLLSDLGKAVAVLLLIVQVSAAGALLPVELSDELFQFLHPYLPMTWAVKAFRASLFGAYDGVFWPHLVQLWTCGGLALLFGTLVGHWRVVPVDQWRPPLDL
jgi:putative membrane protein